MIYTSLLGNKTSVAATGNPTSFSISHPSITADFFSEALTPYSFLLHRKYCGDPVRKDQLEAARVQVLEKGLTSRFLYEVGFQGKVVAYLIGSMHFVTSAIAKDPIFLDVVKRCNHLFLETIPDGFNEFVSDLTEIGPVPINDSPVSEICYSLDYSLACAAIVSGIIAEGLESKLDGQIVDEKVSKLKYCPSLFSSDYQENIKESAWLLKANDEERGYILFELYQTGDAVRILRFFKLLMFPEMFNLMVSERNIKWLYESQIISRLKQIDQPPLGFVLGLAHLLGKQDENGIIPILRREGFTVTRKNS